MDRYQRSAHSWLFISMIAFTLPDLQTDWNDQYPQRRNIKDACENHYPPAAVK